MLSLNDFFFNENSKKLLLKWIKEDYRDKPLCIYGKDGIGKTSLAKCLLNEYKIINIDTDFIKLDKDFNEYIDMSLGKKNICMMFANNKEKVFKSILFDDIHIIQNSDKSLFKNIISFTKNLNKNKNKKYQNNPIIFILPDNCIVKKTYKEIIINSLLIELKYTDNQFNKIINKLLNEEKIFISLNHIHNLIKKSGRNLCNIISNIKLLNKNEMNNELTIDIIYENDFKGEMNDITFKILNNKLDINTILSYIYNDYNIISLNLLDNIHKFFLLKNGEFLNDYLKIYESICLGDKMNSDMIVEHNYELMDYILIQHVVYPVYKIKEKYFKEIKEIQYNKYISKTIYYISNLNTCIKNNLNVNDIYYELFLYDNKLNKEKNIDKKVLEKYIKIYNWIYGKSIKKSDLLK